MTLLTMVNYALRKIGQPPATAVVASTDETTLRLLAIAQDEGRELADYGDWRVLRKEKTFTTVSAEEQSGQTPIPTDLAGFIDGTMWNRSARRRIEGPLSPEEWQAIKSQSVSPVLDAFYLRGASWLMRGHSSGQTIAYEYRTVNWCQSSGGTGQSAWAADTDTGVLSERLMGLGLVWRYKQSRGLDWQTDYDHYMFQVNTALAKDSPRNIISLAEYKNPGGNPMIVLPEGNWNL